MSGAVVPFPKTSAAPLTAAQRAEAMRCFQRPTPQMVEAANRLAEQFAGLGLPPPGPAAVWTVMAAAWLQHHGEGAR